MRKIYLLTAILLFVFSTGIAVAEEDWIVSVSPEEQTPDPLNQARILMRWMTEDELIGQMIMVCPEDMTGEKRTERMEEAAAFEKLPVGGVILYGQNITSETQLKALINDINTGAGKAGLYPPFIAVDEEGGAVARIANKLGLEGAADAAEIGETGDAAKAYQAGVTIGTYLKEYGVNMDLAPVADVMTASAPELKGRSYGSDAGRVADMSTQMAKGLWEQGIIPCYKHFPGHGAADHNAHNVPVRTGRTIAQMAENEWIPFQTAIDQDAKVMMMSHLKVTALDKEYPASLSRIIVTDLLRTQMGYDGVVMTDALRMDAIREEYSLQEAAVLAINAGADILLVPGDGKAAFNAVKGAVERGEISMERIEESVARILALKIESGLIQ